MRAPLFLFNFCYASVMTPLWLQGLDPHQGYAGYRAKMTVEDNLEDPLGESLELIKDWVDNLIWHHNA